MRPTVKTIQKLWKDCEPEVLGKNRQSLGYIQELAAKCGVPIARWNLLRYFGDGDTNNLIHDFKAINKAFFEKMNSKDLDPEENIEVDPRLREILSGFARRLHDQELRVARSEYERHTNSYRNYYNSYQTALTRAMQQKQKILDLEENTAVDNRAKKVEDAIVEVCEGGFWGDPIVGDDGAIWLRTMTDIVLSQRSKSAGIDTTINLGMMSVRLDLRHSRCEVYPYKKNLTAGHHYHPHIDSDGSVCWGDAYRTVGEALADWDVKVVLNLLSGLLTTYNSGNPYVMLADFSRKTPYSRHGWYTNAHSERDAAEARKKRIEKEKAKRAEEAQKQVEQQSQETSEKGSEDNHGASTSILNNPPPRLRFDPQATF